MGEHKEYRAILLRPVEETHRVSAKDDEEALALAQALVRWVNRQEVSRSHKVVLFAIEELCPDGSSRRVPITGDERPQAVFAKKEPGERGSLKCGSCGSKNLREEWREPIYSWGTPQANSPAPQYIGAFYIFRCGDCEVLNTFQERWD